MFDPGMWVFSTVWSSDSLNAKTHSNSTPNVVANVAASGGDSKPVDGEVLPDMAIGILLFLHRPSKVS